MTLGTVRQPRSSGQGSRAALRWLLAVLAVVAVLSVAATVAVRRVQPELKARAIRLLEERFGGRVELDRFDVSWVRGLLVTGGGLRIYPPASAGNDAGRPLVTLRQFRFHSRWRELLLRQIHVGDAYLTGLAIDVPSRSSQAKPAPEPRLSGMSFGVDHVLCDDARLTLEPADPARAPRVFLINRLELTNAGPAQGWRYQAELTNAVPRGQVTTAGSLGPWNTASPGNTPVHGSYTFADADLSTIHGIAGTLRSTGQYGGVFDRLEVMGSVAVPKFSLETAKLPMPLSASFHALVDATTGDTTLDPVEAVLGGSRLTCRGSVKNLRGVGHRTELTVVVPAGRLEDFLALAVHTRPPVMDAVLGLRAQLEIAPGPGRLMDKLRMSGRFTLAGIRFTNPAQQDEVDRLSLRARAMPQEANAGEARYTASTMTGELTLAGAKLDLQSLLYTMPGATVQMAGLYTLDGRVFDFKGTVRTEAKVSEMVGSWWKQLLLMPADRLFNKGGAGTELPFSISGTEGKPKFGVGLPGG